MAQEVVGVVQQLLDKTTDKGHEYVVVRIAGEGHFDWKNPAAQDEVKRGDNVRLQVSEGRYRRIYDVENLGDVEFKKAQAQVPTVPSPRKESRDEFIARLSCARTASLGLSVVQMPVEEKIKELFHLAEELEKWVKRVKLEEGQPDTPPAAGE